jgi:uncharacterized protein (DUF58 family)
MKEFRYALSWRASGRHPGQHPGLQSGGGFEFLGAAPFASQPDPRNLDVHAMVADPLQHLMVRRFRQRATLPVYLLADLSASMGFVGKTSKTALLAEFAAAVAWSASRSGDPFGCYACDHAILWDLSLALRQHNGMPAELRQRLEGLRPGAKNALGLLEAARLLGRQRALVFLVSDFHLPSSRIGELFHALIRHDVVPVVLWDSGEYEHLPRFGLAQLQDPETGQRRCLFLRPSLLQRIRGRFAERREELTAICTSHGRKPFFLVDAFDPDAMTRYFYPS